MCNDDDDDRLGSYSMFLKTPTMCARPLNSKTSDTDTESKHEIYCLYMYVCLCVCPSVCLPTANTSINIFICMSMCLSICMSVSVHLYVHLSVCFSFKVNTNCKQIYTYVHVFVHPSVCFVILSCLSVICQPVCLLACCSTC